MKSTGLPIRYSRFQPQTYLFRFYIDYILPVVLPQLLESRVGNPMKLQLKLALTLTASDWQSSEGLHEDIAVEAVAH